VANETLARRYATAVFTLAADAGAVEAVGKDLGIIAGAIEGEAAVKGYFTSPVVARGDKEKTMLGAFSGKVGEIALHTLLLLVRKRREALLPELVTEYAKIARGARGVELLTVTSAREIPANELQAIVDRLERAYGKKFEASVELDPALIGGVRIAMGDRVIDGSVAGRLEELTRTLFGAGN